MLGGRRGSSFCRRLLERGARGFQGMWGERGIVVGRGREAACGSEKASARPGLEPDPAWSGGRRSTPFGPAPACSAYDVVSLTQEYQEADLSFAVFTRSLRSPERPGPPLRASDARHTTPRTPVEPLSFAELDSPCASSSTHRLTTRLGNRHVQTDMDRRICSKKERCTLWRGG